MQLRAVMIYAAECGSTARQKQDRIRTSRSLLYENRILSQNMNNQDEIMLLCQNQLGSLTCPQSGVKHNESVHFQINGIQVESENVLN